MELFQKASIRTYGPGRLSDQDGWSLKEVGTRESSLLRARKSGEASNFLELPIATATSWPHIESCSLSKYQQAYL